MCMPSAIVSLKNDIELLYICSDSILQRFQTHQIIYRVRDKEKINVIINRHQIYFIIMWFYFRVSSQALYLNWNHKHSYYPESDSLQCLLRKFSERKWKKSYNLQYSYVQHFLYEVTKISKRSVSLQIQPEQTKYSNSRYIHPLSAAETLNVQQYKLSFV